MRPTTANIILIKVKPNASAGKLEQLNDGTWLARLKSPPVDGKANEELIRLVADYFNVARVRVSIKSGARSKLKRIRIERC